MSPLVAGVLFGIGATVVLALALVGAIDNRYVTRREYVATLKDIERQLSDIKDSLK